MRGGEYIAIECDKYIIHITGITNFIDFRLTYRVSVNSCIDGYEYYKALPTRHTSDYPAYFDEMIKSLYIMLRERGAVFKIQRYH